MIAATWWSKIRTATNREYCFDIDILGDDRISAAVDKDQHGTTITIRGLSAPEQLLPIADRIYSVCGLVTHRVDDPAQLTIDTEVQP